jgi:hypothetical protein
MPSTILNASRAMTLSSKGNKPLHSQMTPLPVNDAENDAIAARGANAWNRSACNAAQIALIRILSFL